MHKKAKSCSEQFCDLREQLFSLLKKFLKIVFKNNFDFFTFEMNLTEHSVCCKSIQRLIFSHNVGTLATILKFSR
jgi:hypothetical protein